MLTGDPLVDLGISLAGTLLLVGLSFALGAWRGVTLDAASAAERLAFDEPDFRAEAWLVGADKRAALAVDASGRDIAVVFTVGDGLATRRFPAGSKPVSREGRSLTVMLGEISKRRVTLATEGDAQAEAWAGRLSASALS